MNFRSNLSFAALSALTLALAATAGCSAAPAPDEESGETSSALMGDQARILQTIGPDATVDGRFDPRVRVVGYLVEAKANAVVAVTLDAKIGTDATGTAPLDLLMVVYPYSSAGLGAPIATSVNGQALATVPVRFVAPSDGQFLVAFMSWNDTGTGTYKLKTACTGTDFQCRRPRATAPCTPGTIFVRGNLLPGDTSWDQCEVVLLEPVSVPAGATLTIRPGVTVKGNYLGTGDFGNVSLSVSGTLQAAGTPEAPIAFTSFVANKGWAGLFLFGKNNTISDAYIERASTGIYLGQASSATLSDLVVQGTGSASPACINADRASEVSLTRSVVKKCGNGITVTDVPVFNISHTVIRDNTANGVNLPGPAVRNCGATSITAFRDPVITNSEIRKNGGSGIYVAAPNTHLVVSQSLLTENTGPALNIDTNALQASSYIRDNNIVANNGGTAQITSFHASGSLDISSNFWNAISDPALSANWRFNCSSTGFTFTRFSPTAIPNVGPDYPNMRAAVRAAASNP